MFGSDLLGVAVGLAVLYLLLSIVCSAGSELIESLLKYRAQHLARGLREMLADPDGSGMVKKLYEHPLIFALFQGSYDAKRFRNLPSYIPSHAFAVALLDIARGSTSGSDIRAPVANIRDVVAQSAALPLPLKTAVLSLIDAAGGDPDRAVQKIEDWYDATMDRVGGWYKRHTQWVLLALGLGVAIALNADTIAVFRSLVNNPAERSALVGVAQEYAKAYQAPAPTAAPVSSAPMNQSVGESSKACSTPECRVRSSLNDIRSRGLPLTWSKDVPGAVPTSLQEAGLKALGLLLTAILVTFGAPFWFDLLNKIVTLRATFKPTDK